MSERRPAVPRNTTLVLETDHGVVTLGPDVFVVFIDETGEESFRDPRYPLFGLGGCAVQVGHFEEFVDLPWRYMKNQWFGGEDSRLHAADLLTPTADQLKALAHLFTRFEFCRVAAMISADALLGTDHPPYQLVAGVLMKRIAAVASWQRFSRVALVFEASDRGDPLAMRYFNEFESLQAEGRSMPIEKYLAPKSLISGMEVADFVMHAAGGAVRTWMQTGEKPRRRDYTAVFNSVDERLVSYLNITKTEASEP